MLLVIKEMERRLGPWSDKSLTGFRRTRIKVFHIQEGESERPTGSP
jgi:hypothetical protein